MVNTSDYARLTKKQIKEMRDTNKELKNINGGAAVSGSVISGVVRGVNTFLDLGRALGSSLRRLGNGSICPI